MDQAQRFPNRWQEGKETEESEDHHETIDTKAGQSLEEVVEAQRREIALLRERLSAVGVDPDQSRTPLDPGRTRNEGMWRSLPKRISVQEERAVQVVSGLTEDQAVGLAFPALLRGFTDNSDIGKVKNMCKLIVGDGIHGDWEVLFKSFYDEVVAAKESMPSRILSFEASLPVEWYKEPWYLLYVQWTGVPKDAPECGAGFDSLSNMLPYIRDHLGFRNVCLLSHYESPMADGGYDVSDFVTRESLGGEEAFKRFMKQAVDLNMRVITDAVFNHTSTAHDWFQKALAGDEKYLAFYVQRNGREKVAEWDRNGDIVCQYRDPDGTITERVVVFPDIDRTHGLWAEIHGRTYQFYRGFFPFQVDLNLQNPDVLSELFRVLAREVKQGVVGKRMDAIAHWIKQPGCASEGLPECHALQGLLKSFLSHINSRCILMPEVVRDMANASQYAGSETWITSSRTTSEGDAILSFEMQGALREATYFQTVAPYWQKVFRSPSLPGGSTWINLLEHHDETFMGFFEPEVRVWMCEYIKTHGGAVYKNGMSAGGRLADCLNAHPRRIATALFLLYITPGTPLVYAGTEIGARSQASHADAQMVRSHDTFQKLGVYAAQRSCYDARELQRGPLRREAFDRAVSEGYEATEMVRRLNRVRRTRRWMREGGAKAVDSGDVGVLCMGRGAPDDTRDRALCVANLTGVVKWAAVPVRQAAACLAAESGPEAWVDDVRERRRRFVDVVSGQPVEPAVDDAKMVVMFRLEAFACAAVEEVASG